MTETNEVDKLIFTFQKINAQCLVAGGSVVPLTDEEYYTSQLHNLFSDTKSFEECERLAKQIAERAVELNKELT
jgi:hypothetical protein